MEKYESLLVTSEKIWYFFTEDNITFICFWYAYSEFTAGNKIKCNVPYSLGKASAYLFQLFIISCVLQPWMGKTSRYCHKMHVLNAIFQLSSKLHQYEVEVPNWASLSCQNSMNMHKSNNKVFRFKTTSCIHLKYCQFSIFYHILPISFWGSAFSITIENLDKIRTGNSGIFALYL